MPVPPGPATGRAPATWRRGHESDIVVGAGRRPNNTGGIGCILGGMLIITLMDSAVKWLSPDYALHQIMLSRGLLGLLIVFVFLHLEGGLHLVRSHRAAWHLLRGGLIFLANMAFFLAVAAMPLAEAIALFFVAPLFITILSIVVLGERVGPRRWAAIFVGLAGVVVMLRPGTGVFDWVALLPIAAALSYASVHMLARRLGATERASTMVFYTEVTFITLSLAIGLSIGDGHLGGTGNTSLDFLFRAWHWPESGDLWLFAWCGIASGCGGFLISQAYRLGEAAVVAPFENVALPLGVIWGLLFWQDWPDLASGAGMTLILGAGLYVFFRENPRAARGRRRPPPA